MADAMRTDPLKDAPIIPPQKRPVAHTVLGGIMDDAGMILTARPSVDTMQRLTAVDGEGVLFWIVIAHGLPWMGHSESSWYHGQVHFNFLLIQPTQT